MCQYSHYGLKTIEPAIFVAIQMLQQVHLYGKLPSPDYV